MNPRRAYIYFALTFLLGVLVGGVGLFFYGWHMGSMSGPARRERMIWRMTRHLNLNDGQVQQIRAILEETGGKVEALRKQHRPEFDAIRTDSRDRIRKVLTPEQATKFDEIVKRFDERRQRYGRPPG
ncbi:MAG: hypothetical protein HY508_03375 [Acidobacteria bacterium]|nr:hypothetical protein [Acidobacteriota bacterium]